MLAGGIALLENSDAPTAGISVCLKYPLKHDNLGLHTFVIAPVLDILQLTPAACDRYSETLHYTYSLHAFFLKNMRPQISCM